MKQPVDWPRRAGKESSAQQLHQPFCRLLCILRRAEGGKPEISFPACSKAFSRRSHYLDLLEQVVEKLPASHSIRAFHPNIRSVFPSAVPDAEPIQYFRQTSSILFIDLNPLPNLPLSFFRKYSRSSFLDKIRDTVCFRRPVLIL